MVGDIDHINSLQIRVLYRCGRCGRYFAGFFRKASDLNTPFKNSSAVWEQNLLKAALQAIDAVELLIAAPWPAPVRKCSNRLLSRYRNGSIYKGVRRCSRGGAKKFQHYRRVRRLKSPRMHKAIIEDLYESVR
jgi:hypothetical protein